MGNKNSAPRWQQCCGIARDAAETNINPPFSPASPLAPPPIKDTSSNAVTSLDALGPDAGISGVGAVDSKGHVKQRDLESYINELSYQDLYEEKEGETKILGDSTTKADTKAALARVKEVVDLYADEDFDANAHTGIEASQKHRAAATLAWTGSEAVRRATRQQIRSCVDL